MIAAYGVKWTDHEFGRRPDGLSLHDSMETAQKFIEEKTGGTRDQYWTASEPELMVIEPHVARVLGVKGTLWANSTGWTVDDAYVNWAIRDFMG